MIDAYIYDGLRTPFGRHGGGLSRIRPDDLLADVMRAVVGRSPFDAKTIDDVMIGCANQAGEDGRCVARHALLVAGLPVEVPGTVLQRNCASGLGAVVSAAHAITCGEGDVILAGGLESMSRAPFVVAKSESAFSRDFTVFDTTVGARFPNPKISKAFGEDTMPQTAVTLAVEYQIAREDCDAFAARSQAGYAVALKDEFFKDEIHSIVIPGGKKGPDVTVAADEGPRADTSLDKLAKLRADRRPFKGHRHAAAIRLATDEDRRRGSAEGGGVGAARDVAEGVALQRQDDLRQRAAQHRRGGAIA